MSAVPDRLSGAPGYVFSDGATVFAAYLPTDAPEARLALPDGPYTVRWFNPRTGGPLRRGAVSQVRGGDVVALGTPPSAPQRDWVVKVTRADSAQVK